MTPRPALSLGLYPIFAATAFAAPPKPWPPEDGKPYPDLVLMDGTGQQPRHNLSTEVLPGIKKMLEAP